MITKHKTSDSLKPKGSKKATVIPAMGKAIKLNTTKAQLNT